MSKKRGRKESFSIEKQLRICIQYIENNTTTKLARAWHTTPAHIARILRKWGVPVAPRGSLIIRDWNYRDVMKDFRKGMSYNDLSDKYRCSVQSIREVLKRYVERQDALDAWSAEITNLKNDLSKRLAANLEENR